MIIIPKRYPGGTTLGSLARELAPQRLRELTVAAAIPHVALSPRFSSSNGRAIDDRPYGGGIWGGCNNAGPVRPMATPSALAVSATTAGSSLAREPGMEEIHVVGESCLAEYLLSGRTTLTTRPQAPSRPRLRRRRCGRKATLGLAAILRPRCGLWQLPQPSAAPSRGSRVLKDPCRRGDFSAERFYLHALPRRYDPQAPSRGSWLAPQARD